MNQSNQNIVDIKEAPPIPATFSSGGGDGTDARLSAIETQLAALNAHLQHFATKVDVHEMKSSLLMWGASILVTVIFGIVAVVFKFVS